MARKDSFVDSLGAGRIHVCSWFPEDRPRGIVQIIHGIAEHVRRYDELAEYLNSLGYLVVAEDHMGHGESVNGEGIQGYFHGGWFTAVEDSYGLLTRTRQEFPELPYVLLGHSMGSFMTRTILCKHPDSGISAAVICGTGWQPRAMLPAAIALCQGVCRASGETKPSPFLENLVFGSYNKRVEHPRTAFDWLTRDAKTVDDYIADPMCGFTATAGLLRELLVGIRYIEDPKSLAAMNRNIPVLFIAGGDDPVGSYGDGVRRAAEAFRKAGVKNVAERIYPLCRHELFNEINRSEIRENLASWMENTLNKS